MFFSKPKADNKTINAALQLTKLKVTPTSLKTGLTSSEVATRVSENKTNLVANKTSKTTGDILVSNLLTVFNFLTFGIAIWLMTIGSYRNTIFLGAVIINITIGIIQELKAKKMIEQLSLVSAPVVKVFRDKKFIDVSSNDVVQDDVIKLKIGDQICADCVVLKGKVEVNESLLTGETDAIVKGTGHTLYSGSYVISGDCLAQAALVGEESYIQKLASQAKKYRKPKSEIMNSLKILIRVITVLVIIIGVTLFLEQYVKLGVPYEEAVLATAGGVIGMIPSGLFLLTSVSLSLGVIKLSKRKTLVNDLYCIEMLARVNTLCLDKTGTITDGTMKVKDIIELNKDQLPIGDLVALLESTFNDNNPTSVALKKKFGKKALYKASAVIPFSSVRKFSAASYKELKSTYLLGAPEFIFKKRYDEIKVAVEAQAKQGYRVLLVASTFEGIKEDNSFNEGKIIPLALICIEDTIRRAAVDTIAYFKKIGVAVKVISGDNPLTVAQIAKRAGVEHAEKCISLEGKLDAQLEHLALSYNVFGRVTPVQKKRLIEIYKKHRGVVAMTGDGVNDILAMKEADCAIAMANGSEATRNIAHLVLMDSNFDSLPTTVQEGRRVINNIQRVATLFLTKSMFSFFLAIIVICLGRTYPLQTVQLLFYDFLVISLPSIYLAIEPNNANIKGRFLQNVLVSAFPGALLVAVNYLALILNAQYLMTDMTTPAISTAMVLISTCLGLFVLFKVCKPFNLGRMVMYGFMWFIFIFALLKYASFFSLTHLTYQEFLLTLVLILASLSVYPWINRTALAFKNWVLKLISKKRRK